MLQAQRSTYHYVSISPPQADLKKRIKEVAETRVRYGYRRIHVLLRREGWLVNAKRVYRLYQDLGLQLRNKTPKRKVRWSGFFGQLFDQLRCNPAAVVVCCGLCGQRVALSIIFTAPA